VQSRNDTNRERQMQTKIKRDMEIAQRQLAELRTLVESLKDTNLSLHADIIALQETVSEQKVCV